MHKSVLSLLMSVSLASPLTYAYQLSDAAVMPSEAARSSSHSSSGGGGGGSFQASRPEPQSRPAPQPQSRPAPQPQSRPAPMPQSRPAPQPQSRPAPMPQSRPAPQPMPQHQPQHQPAPQPMPQPQPQHQTQHQPAPQPMPQPQPQHQTQHQPAPQPMPQPQPQHQTQHQPAPQPMPQPQPQHQTQHQPPPHQPGVNPAGDRTRNAHIEAPTAPRAQAKGPATVNRDHSVTQRYNDGSSVRRGADGKVISQYDASTHKTVYSNHDGSTTVAQGARSVRTYQNGDKVVRNAGNHEVSTFNSARNQTTIRSPGRQVVIDHNSGAMQVRHGREQYQQFPHSDGRGYSRNVRINNINITRVYNYNYNRYGGWGSYYYPGIYTSPYFGLFAGGFYGGFGYYGNIGYYVNPWGYGWSIWRTYPAEVCWWGGCNYVGYGYSPYSPYSWRADYGYYYSPVVSIVNPIDYLLGTLISEALEDRRQSRLEAEAAERQEQIEREQAIADAARQDEQQAEVLRDQAAEELREIREEKARNAAVTQQQNSPMSQEAIDAQKNTVNHISTSIAQKAGSIDVIDFLTSDKGVHGFQIHDALTVGVENSDNQCNLDQGDVVAVRAGFAVTKDTDNVLVKVLSSVPGDCRPGVVVNIGIDKLQEMLNANVEKVNDAMNDMATKKMGQKK